MRLILERWSRVLLFASASSLVLVSAQNCDSYHSPMNSFQLLSLGDDFFGYAYSSAPSYFISSMMVQPTNASDDYTLSFVAAVALASGQPSATSYQVQIVDENGLAICPGKVGSLAENETTIELTCVRTTRAIKEIKTLVHVESGSLSQTEEKTYPVLF